MIARSHRTTARRAHTPGSLDNVASLVEYLICQGSDRTQQSANWTLREVVIPRGVFIGLTQHLRLAAVGATMPVRPPGAACAGGREMGRACGARKRTKQTRPQLE